jgi:hypothetical protein
VIGIDSNGSLPNGSANGSFHRLVRGRDDPARALYAFNFGRSEQFRSNISLPPFLCIVMTISG